MGGSPVYLIGQIHMLLISKRLLTKHVLLTKANGAPFYFPVLNNSVLKSLGRTEGGRSPWWGREDRNHGGPKQGTGAQVMRRTSLGRKAWPVMSWPDQGKEGCFLGSENGSLACGITG